MHSLKLPFICTLLLCLAIAFTFSPVGQAASLDNTSPSGGIFTNVLQFVYEKILSPILQLLHPQSQTVVQQSTPLPGPVVESKTPTVTETSVFKGKRILVDPGHGGTNPGAVQNGYREADNNLAVALLVSEQLKQAGAEVLLTRKTDQNVAPVGSTLSQELQSRVDKAESFGASVFVSIHTNENPNSAITGLSVYYNQEQSKGLAQDLQQALIEATGAKDRGILKDNFYVIRTPSMPSVLIEMGFISNPAEARLMSTTAYREKVAQGIIQGLNQYFQ